MLTIDVCIALPWPTKIPCVEIVLLSRCIYPWCIQIPKTIKRIVSGISCTRPRLSKTELKDEFKCPGGHGKASHFHLCMVWGQSVIRINGSIIPSRLPPPPPPPRLQKCHGEIQCKHISPFTNVWLLLEETQFDAQHSPHPEYLGYTYINM